MVNIEAKVATINGQIGARIRIRRVALGMSQTQLGEHIGVSFQQIQKYETGSNGISVGRIMMLAHALQVSPAFFFGIEDSEADNTIAKLLGERGATEILLAYAGMTPAVRKAFLELARRVGVIADVAA